jgi:hypothetical protein
MPATLRNVIALVVGVVLGGVVNMALITLGPSIIPPPPGVDMTNTESLIKGVGLLQPQHFIMPFLAHAIGTFVGALAAWLIAASWRKQITFAVGVVFLCGGIAASYMIPAPTWFKVLDLVVAYLPMAWLATVVGSRLQPRTGAAPSMA